MKDYQESKLLSEFFDLREMPGDFEEDLLYLIGYVRKKSDAKSQDYLDYLRVGVKALFLDSEATKREYAEIYDLLGDFEADECEEEEQCEEEDED